MWDGLINKNWPSSLERGMTIEQSSIVWARDRQTWIGRRDKEFDGRFYENKWYWNFKTFITKFHERGCFVGI